MVAFSVPSHPVGSMILINDLLHHQNPGLFGGSSRQEVGGGAAKAARSPPLRSEQARSSESGKEKQVGGERMQSTSAADRDSVFEKNT